MKKIENKPDFYPIFGNFGKIAEKIAKNPIFQKSVKINQLRFFCL